MVLFVSSRIRHTICALVTGVQTCALPIYAMADNSPLRKTVAKYVDQAMLDAIAAEHEKGRILVIGTTNLDARRPVIWDIGAIAASGHPRALEQLGRASWRASGCSYV